MQMTDWAARWGVSAEAMHELTYLLGAMQSAPNVTEAPGSEAFVQSAVRLEASRKGYHLWRNNVGAGYMKDGAFLRFGLCNDSKQINAVCKSSDLVGIGPRGQFVARECKPAGWVYRGTAREVAQLNFITLVTASGGDARFCTGEGTL